MKKVLWIAAAAAVVFALAWPLWPRPLLRSSGEEVYRVMYWDGSDYDPLEVSAEEEAALVDVLSDYRRRVKSLYRGSYYLDEYPVEISLHDPDGGGGWHVTAGPKDAFVYNGSSRVTWRILESEALWQELMELLPVEP